ncbi:MAG TPA: L,D-transpeptidase family protein [Candidatus Binataceae bacterium]|jgi:L,D-transpeptidase ErfK/SrfK
MAKKYIGWVVALVLCAAMYAVPSLAHDWHSVDFANRPLYAYPLPAGRDDIIGSLTTYTIQKGDTLLDVGRWFGLSAKEISDANGHMDWWLPPAGREVILPTEHILPQTSRSGIILNVPEMRLYYYYPSPTVTRHKRGKLTEASYGSARVVYTFPVGLGRFDWKTPLGVWRVTAKVKNPTWTMPEDIYQEHVERDGYADRFVPAGPDNPLGLFKLDLSIPEYGLHGTNVPWGIGMTVSHGCVRLYPEDIERLFSKTPVGTPGEFVYQPVKFGWRGGVLYAEVHDDLYGKYPGLWNLAAKEVRSQNLAGQVDMGKLEKLVEAKSGIPTYVGFGPTPPSAALPILTASDTSSESGASASSEGPSTAVPSSAALAPSTGVAPPASAGMSAPGAPAAPNEASTDDDAASNSALGPSTTIAPATTIGPSGPAGSSAASAPAPANDTSSDDDAATTPDNAGANPGPPSRDTSIVTGTAATVHRSTTIGTATVPAPTSASGPGLPTSIVKSADDDTDSGSDWEPTGRTNP